MAEYEEKIRALEEKLRSKDEELNEFKESARCDKTRPNKSDTSKTEAAPKGNKRRQKNYQNVYHNRPSQRNEDKYCYEEYHVTKRVFYPEERGFYPEERGFYRSPFPLRHRGLEDPRMSFNSNNDFLPHFQHDRRTQPFRKNTTEKSQKSHFNEENPCNQTILKMKQNQQPFKIVKAFKPRSCSACRKKIAVSSVMAKHREIECYPHPKLGWKEPMYSENMITQFYHMDENCLKNHGFEKEYLNLCYIEVDEKLNDTERKLIHRCGFLRPAMEKKSEEINVTKMLSLKLSDSDIKTESKEKENEKTDSEIKSKVSNCDAKSTDEEDSYDMC